MKEDNTDLKYSDDTFCRFCGANNKKSLNNRDAKETKEELPLDLKKENSKTQQIKLRVPECCKKSLINFFKQCKRENKSPSKQDILLNICEESETFKEYPFENNCLIKDANLITHFPCSWECKNSKAMGLLQLEYSENKEHKITKLKTSVFLSREFNIIFKENIKDKRILSAQDIKEHTGVLPEFDTIISFLGKLEFFRNNKICAVKKGYLLNFS